MPHTRKTGQDFGHYYRSFLMLHLPKRCRELSEEGGKKEERAGVKGKEGEQLLKYPLLMEAETPVRSGFKSFGCRLTGLVCELAEHSHGINVKSLLKWSNFK